MAVESEDMQAHVRTYALFSSLMKWGAIVCLILGLIILRIIY